MDINLGTCFIDGCETSWLVEAVITPLGLSREDLRDQLWLVLNRVLGMYESWVVAS